MKSRMKESYMEGIANHHDPESLCLPSRGFGRSVAGADAGPVLSSEITLFLVPMPLREVEDNTGGVATRETPPGLVVSETRPHAPKLHARERGGRARHSRKPNERSDWAGDWFSWGNLNVRLERSKFYTRPLFQTAIASGPRSQKLVDFFG